MAVSGFIPRSPDTPEPRPVCDGRRCPRCSEVLLCRPVDLGPDRTFPQWSDKARRNGPRWVDGPEEWCPNAANHQPWMPAASFDDARAVS